MHIEATAGRKGTDSARTAQDQHIKQLQIARWHKEKLQKGTSRPDSPQRDQETPGAQDA